MATAGLSHSKEEGLCFTAVVQRIDKFTHSKRVTFIAKKIIKKGFKEDPFILLLLFIVTEPGLSHRNTSKVGGYIKRTPLFPGC